MRLVGALPVWSALIAASLRGARAMEKATPKEVNMNETRLDQITTELKNMVDDGKLVGAAFVITRGGKYVYHGEAGYSDKETRTPFRTNNICRLLSMSKPMAAAGFMKMIELGYFNFDTKLESILPEYKDLRVYVSNTQDGVVVTEPIKRSITVLDLLTHTSGLSYGYGFGNLTFVDTLYPSTWEVPSLSMDEFSKRIAKVPLLYQPGNKWRYSWSYDVLGVAMWKLTGESPDIWMKKNIFDPLKMNDTGFSVPSDKIQRYTTTYTELDLMGYKRFQFVFRPRMDMASYRPPTFKSMGGGIVSTAKDAARFAQMLLNGGILDGVRVLQPSSVDLMWRNYLRPDQLPIELNGWTSDANAGYGLGGTVSLSFPVLSVSNWDTFTGDNRRGGFAWGGGAQTNSQANADADTVVTYMTQKMGGEDFFQSIVMRGLWDSITGPSPRKEKGGISSYSGVPSPADNIDGFGNNVEPGYLRNRVYLDSRGGVN